MSKKSGESPLNAVTMPEMHYITWAVLDSDEESITQYTAVVPETKDGAELMRETEREAVTDMWALGGKALQVFHGECCETLSVTVPIGSVVYGAFYGIKGM